VYTAYATDTFLLKRDVNEETLRELTTCFADRAFLVQPFISNIHTEGEYSLFYMGGEYSHCIQKTPRTGDFRVQEEYGSEIVRVDPEDHLLGIADKVSAKIQPRPVYCRSDYVRDERGDFLLMELELIEPSLYLRMDNTAPRRFANVLDRHVRRQTNRLT
jgi:glutathione synthase/RimK-type ligase-like ATP-grasp enzyme